MSSDLAILLVLIAVYALAALIGGWLVLDMQRRRVLQERMQHWGEKATSGFVNIGCRIQRSSTASQQHTIALWSGSVAFFARHKWHTLAAGALLLIPLAIVLSIQPARSLPGYEDLPPISDAVIVALLRGEQLAPPPPMPPEAFMTPEVTAVRQDLPGASREWMLLDPDFRQRLLTVFHLMEQRGYPMALLEGYRSPERQAYLASLGPQVTNAGAFQSFHQFGLAADCAFVRNGKLVISEKDPWAMQGYRLYGELAESVGLVWGGRWKMMDFGHVELRRTNVLLRAEKKQLQN